MHESRSLPVWSGSPSEMLQPCARLQRAVSIFWQVSMPTASVPHAAIAIASAASGAAASTNRRPSFIAPRYYGALPATKFATQACDERDDSVRGARHAARAAVGLAAEAARA